jgi:hypothetical protein
MQLRKEKPGCMIVKYDFSQEFMEIEYTKNKSNHLPPKTKLKTFNEHPRGYNRRLAISIDTKEDFLSLC